MSYKTTEANIYNLLEDALKTKYECDNLRVDTLIDKLDILVLYCKECGSTYIDTYYVEAFGCYPKTYYWIHPTWVKYK